jgi:hypothetical protein
VTRRKRGLSEESISTSGKRQRIDHASSSQDTNDSEATYE